MTKRRVDSIVFDLDGTLIDSLPGIEASLRVAATVFDPPRIVPPIRSIIGPPVAKMMERLWPDLAELERRRAIAAFRAHYDSEGCLLSPLYPGVASTLESLRAAGIKLFVLTNKPTKPTQKILEQAAIDRYFDATVSPDSNDPPFAVKSAGAAWLRERHHLAPEMTLLVGDGADDADAAASCGFGFVAAGYGYGAAAKRPDLERLATLETFSEIMEIVL
jgi:phosphoglycolate phosphatase